jgi:peptidoglycan/xylan/chitin deacetylase (PgdA/CDA1 family)
MRHAVIRLIQGVSARFPRIAPVVWSVHRHKGCIAVTFDDGPTGVTPQVLECLARYGAKATFFVLGNQVRKRPEVLRQVLAEGHEVAIHGYEHSLRDYYRQVRRCAKELSGYGVSPRIVRTPGGAIRPLLTMRLWWGKYPLVKWSLDAHDSMRLEGKWKGPAPDYSRVEGGDIVLMHDDNSLCLKELPILLDSIKQRDLRPVTVSELIGLGPRR